MRKTSRVYSRKDPVERFWTFVSKGSDCWNWMGARIKKGYGRFGGGGKHGRDVYAHRFSYELHHGSIPEGMMVCHRCDNPSCVKPEHLFLGTNRDNMADCRAKGRTLTGERNTSARLTEQQVVAIRSEYATGEVTQKQLAIKYGVCKAHISDIVRRKKWADLRIVNANDV